MAHSYSHLYGIPTTGLRFFTVYGPWGRPDMALFLFTKSILKEEPIKIFNKGEMIRDFTFIDDITESLFRVINKKASSDSNFDYLQPSPSSSWAPYKIFNIGNSNPINLMDFISTIEEILGRKAKKEFLDMQPGDVASTSADTELLENWIGFKPRTSVKEGIKKFIDWYKDFYNIKINNMKIKNISNLPIIENCTICIVGLGYVGLPLAIEFSKIKTCLRTGKKLKRDIIGFDLNRKRIEELKLGLDTTKETEEKDLK